MATTEEVIIDVSVTGATKAESQMDGLAKSVDGVTEATDEADKATEEYSKTLSDTIKDTRIMGVSMNSLSQGFSGTTKQIANSVKGLKLFKVALAATGIGLFIVALGTLATFLTKSQKGIDLVSKAMDAMGAVVDVVTQRLIIFGEGVADFVSGDFRIGIEKMGAAFDDMGKDIVETTQASWALSDAQAELERQQIAFITREAELRAIRKEQNADAENLNFTLERRVQASKNAEAAERERAGTSIKLAKEELRLLEERNAQGESTREDIRAEQELRANIFRIQEESAEFLTTQGNKTRLLQDQIRKADLQAATDLASTRVGLEEAVSVGTIKLAEDTSAALSRIKKQDTDVSRQQAAIEIEIERAKNREILGLTAEFFGASAALAGQDSEIGKVLAIAEATINTWTAATAALGDRSLTTAGRLISFATVVATGLEAVKNIQGTPIPKVDVQETSFADGGFIGGKPHSRGGTWINAEKGEYMISKNRMAIPGVRRSAMALNNYKQSGRGGKHALGGDILGAPSVLNNQIATMTRAMNQQQTVLVTEDLNTVQRRVAVTESRASI